MVEEMRKLWLALILLSLCVFTQAIIVETGSLNNFLTGHEPACAYDNWISHLAEGIAIPNYNLYAPYDRQTNGFGDFSLPTASDLVYWNDMLSLFFAGDYNGAQSILNNNNCPYQIVEFHDTDTGKTLYILREIPNMQYYDDNGTEDPYDDEAGAFVYGWGIFIYYPEGTKPIIVTVPHPCDDFPTPRMGLQAFNVWDAQYLMINGAGREVRWTNQGTYTNSKSLSDAIRNPTHPFNYVYKKAADYLRDTFHCREWSCQIHSYDWNRHQGYANCQISAGNPRPCPNLPIRDLSPLKNDLINHGHHLMIPSNTVGIHNDVYLNDFYAVNYSIHDFIFTDGVHTYPVNNQIDLPAYSENQQMLYSQAGTTDYDVFEPFFHIEMDELPNSYRESLHNYYWFYGWNELLGKWDMDNLFTHFLEYYDRWIYDIEPVLEAMFQMDDGQPPVAPSNLAVFNQSLNSVTLTWTKGSAFDFDSYEIYYATEHIDESNYQIFDRNNNAFLASPDCERIEVTGLNNSYNYYFKIRARDKNQNYSGLSNEVTTSLAPVTISSFSAFGLDSTVRLYWQIGAQQNNQGFKIYRKVENGEYVLVDSWLTNPALSNPSAYSFEWWDNDVMNRTRYTYKISSTNIYNVEFFYNIPAIAEPRAIHTITISNSSGTLTDQIYFSANPFATDGFDNYWDVTKSTPTSNYVWNAFWEQYWGTNGTHLSREIKGDYDLDNELKTWVMRTRSDQINQTLTISVSDNFDRAEKLYLYDGGNGTYHNLLSGPYQYLNSNSSIRTMTLFWGNMQPKVLITSMANKIYQGGTTINFSWNYQYPFLVDHLELSIINDSGSILLSPSILNNQFSFTWTVPNDVTEMQDCCFVVDAVAIDGVRTRFWSDYHFSLVPQMILSYNEPGLKMRSNPWLNSGLSFNQVFGESQAYELSAEGLWIPTEDYDFGKAYCVFSDEVSFYSGTFPIQSNEYSLNLVPGWNFIPNPHLCAYDLEDLSFLMRGELFNFSEVLAQNLISHAVYVYRNGIYEPVTRIEPWEAFFIRYDGTEDLQPIIRFYPFFNGPSISPSEPGFKLKVVMNEGAPNSIELGLHKNATDDYDFKYDLLKPFPLPYLETNSLWINLPNADSTDSWDLYSEYKAEFTQPKEQKFWNIRLDAVSLEPITFHFEVQGTTPSWQIMMMLDDVSYIVGTSDNFIWTPPVPGIYEGYIRVSNYQVGIDDFVQSPIKGLKIYPNPFNPEVNISFSTASNNNVKINIYNIRGQKITTLYDGKLSAGQHTFHWNGKDSNGRSAASGIYLLRVESGNEHHTLKMILMK